MKLAAQRFKAGHDRRPICIRDNALAVEALKIFEQAKHRRLDWVTREMNL